MGAEITRGGARGAVFSEVVDAAVAFAVVANAEEAVAVERRGVAVAAEARCCCEGVRALAAAAGLDLSFSWGLLFNKRCGILSEDVRARKTRQFRVSIERLRKTELAVEGTRSRESLD